MGSIPPLRRYSERLCCNFRAATSGWTTFGKHRTGSPIMPSDNPFKWRQFEPALILQCVRWYLRYALSYRDLEDMMRERGLCVDHTTIYRWVQRYAPEIDKRCRPSADFCALIGLPLGSPRTRQARRSPRKGQARWMAKGDVVGQTQLIHKVFGLAA